MSIGSLDPQLYDGIDDAGGWMDLLEYDRAGKDGMGWYSECCSS
jgi:hypothetical protein